MSFESRLLRIVYHLKYRYHLREVVTIVLIALAIFWFFWGSVNAMQKNYMLRKVVADKERVLELTKLQVQTLEYEQKYLQSNEYKELSVRDKFGKGLPGEKIVMLPPNTPNTDDETKPEVAQATPKQSNPSQWMNFLFGGNAETDHVN